MDALMVINFLNAGTSGAGEGEGNTGVGLLSASGGDAASRLDVPAASLLATTIDVTSPAVALQRALLPVSAVEVSEMATADWQLRIGQSGDLPADRPPVYPTWQTWRTIRGNLCWIRWPRMSWKPGSTARLPRNHTRKRDHCLVGQGNLRPAGFGGPFSFLVAPHHCGGASHTCTCWAEHQVRSPSASSCDQRASDATDTADRGAYRQPRTC